MRTSRGSGIQSQVETPNAVLISTLWPRSFGISPSATTLLSGAPALSNALPSTAMRPAVPRFSHVHHFRRLSPPGLP